MFNNVSLTQLMVWLGFIIIALSIFLGTSLAYLGKVSLMCFVLALGLFVFSKVPAGLVGMLCLVVAVVLGVPEAMLFNALNQHIVWLMIGAFIMSAVIESSGLLQRLVKWMAMHCYTPLRAIGFMSLAILLMTFTIPSTSSRAAAFMPIFLALKTHFPKYQTFFGLLIPMLILMMTNATLIGAGSHLIGIGILEGQTDAQISYMAFLLWGLPFALIISLLTIFVLRWHIKPNTVNVPLDNASVQYIEHAREPLTSQEKIALSLIGLTILLWLTEALHGFDIAFVTIAMSCIMVLPQFKLIAWNTALKKVSWSLIFFVASATVLGELLVKYKVIAHFQTLFMQGLQHISIMNEWFLILLISVISVMSHLLITSHTTRAVVLIPTFLILCKMFDLNPVAVVFIALIGINYCVTFPVSSKALLIFYELDERPFTTRQLAYLSLYLMPMYIIVMVVMYFIYWQFTGLHLK
ncbi:SLC13 family permease [Staphylococcus agnetis]|uniref:SLC13 family permease n=1 Tax=Staphylococcus agnetis TaxID=985762 RepID=UPI00118AF647|nr:SLC13 family permease [Staphylococcus agnetis]QDW99668.1 SLC13 family permease [Staphylococcus agnetis]